MKAIIFDMDGLMVDTEIISYKCYRDVIESYGYPFTKDDYVKEYPGRSLLTSVKFIKERYQLDFDVNEKVNEFHALEEKYMKIDGVRLKDGLVELLQYLKNHQYKTIVATSSIKSRAERILNDHNIMSYFDDIVCGSEVKRGKPFPDIFLEACKRLEVAPNEALVLEDSEAGIQAAFDANIKVICIPDLKYPHDTYIEKVETIYESLHDVIPYLKNTN